MWTRTVRILPCVEQKRYTRLINVKIVRKATRYEDETATAVLLCDTAFGLLQLAAGGGGRLNGRLFQFSSKVKEGCVGVHVSDLPIHHPSTYSTAHTTLLQTLLLSCSQLLTTYSTHAIGRW